MPRFGLTTILLCSVTLPATLLVGGCAKEHATIDPVPPAPLASGYETQSSDPYAGDGYQPYDPETAGAGEAMVVAEEPVIVAEEPLVVEAADPEPVKDAPAAAPVKDGSGGAAPVKDGGGARTHKVAKGDSLWKLSEKYYGTGLKWETILNANPGINPKKLIVGKELIIP